MSTLSKNKEKKRYGHQRLLKTAEVTTSETGTIKMSKSHRQRYQKARETAMTKLMGQLGKPLLIALTVRFAHLNRAGLAGGDLSGFQQALMTITFFLFVLTETGGF